MSFRQVMIADACHLSIDMNRIKINRKDIENHIPIEDVSIIIVESQEVTFSSIFLTECALQNIPIIICGKNRMPISLTHPINHHYRPYQVLNFQIYQSSEIKEIITEMLLKSKIQNQLNVIVLKEGSEESISLLSTYIDEVQGRDEINREGTAAKVFFNQLYGKNYVRFEEDPINATQNYGYAIYRAAIARYLCAYGFNLCLGVNHCGQTNPFNLVYDFIEPFRPIIDYYISSHLTEITDKLNIRTKKELVNLLNAKVEVNGKEVTVQYAMELLVKSYLRVLENGVISLDLPKIKRIDFDKLNESV